MTALVAVASPTDRYQLFPRLHGDEMSALRQDIAERGVLVPVEVDENGDILDGHHRAEIAAELGIEYPVVVRSGMTEAEKLEHVFALNIARRHLSGHDRTAVIAQCRARGMSLRAIAALTGVSKDTVARSLSVVSDETDELLADAAAPAAPPPVDPGPTLADEAAALRAQGLTQRAIAEALGVSPSTVSNVLNVRPARQAAVRQSADWPATRAFVKELQTFAASDPRQVAATIPDRNRHAMADRLRRVGTFLGSIALELERKDR